MNNKYFGIQPVELIVIKYKKAKKIKVKKEKVNFEVATLKIKKRSDHDRKF